MSFQNSVSWVTLPSRSSININVVPSFGHIVNVGDNDRKNIVRIHSFRSTSSKTGGAERAHSTLNPATSTPPATPPSASRKSSRNPSPTSKSMTMSTGPASAGDLDSDPHSFLLNPSYKNHEDHLITLTRPPPFFHGNPTRPQHEGASDS